MQKSLNLIPDVFVANSQATRQWAHHIEKISPDRIRVIHNGFIGELRPVSDERRIAARQALGLPLDAPVAGMVANLRPVKRIDVFLRAAALAAREFPAARFVVVGEGRERVRLEGLCTELGLADRVMFLGRRSDVMDIMPALDVGVLSSDSESFSNAVIEYMAAGLPVVATDVGGCAEALGESPAGILIRPGDIDALVQAILRFLGDDDLRTLARTMHPRRVQEMFSRVRYLNAYSALFRDLVVAKQEAA